MTKWSSACRAAIASTRSSSSSPCPRWFRAELIQVTSLFLLAQIALAAWTAPAGNQQRACPRTDTYCIEMQRVVSNPRVRRAAEFFERTDAAAIRELIALTQIPAPPFKESERAKRFAEMMRA